MYLEFILGLPNTYIQTDVCYRIINRKNDNIFLCLVIQIMENDMCYSASLTPTLIYTKY